jgi:hypothetical protein
MIRAQNTSETEDEAEDEAEDSSDVYLVEPLRSSSVVKKFTGTFGASHDTDKLTYTILAFNHFIMQDTACLLAFADLQGEDFPFLRFISSTLNGFYRFPSQKQPGALRSNDSYHQRVSFSVALSI